MGAVFVRARSQLRGRWVVTLLLVVCVAVAGGAVLAALAGARRGEAALPAFLRRATAADAVVFTNVTGEPGTPEHDLRDVATALRDLQGVEGVARSVAPILAVRDDAAAGGWHRQLATLTFDRGGTALLGRPIVVDGRLPREDRADEAVVDEELAERRGVAVGDRLRIGVFTAAQADDARAGRPVAPAGAVTDLRVTGVVRLPQDLVPVATDQHNLYVEKTDLYLTPAFWERHGPDLVWFGIGMVVRLDDGAAGFPAFADAVGGELGDQTFVSPIDPDVGLVDVNLDGVRRAIDLESRALQGFAVLAAVAALSLVGQAVGREVALETADDDVLAALGMRPRQLVAVSAVRGAVVGTAGAVLAVGVAVALSPRTPIGVSRRAIVDPGVAVDGAVLVPGAIAVLVVVVLCAVVPGWRTSRRAAAPPPGPARLVDRLAAGGFPPSAVTGVRLALDRGRGRGAVPVRAALVASVVTVLAVVAALGYRAGLQELARHPRAYGVTWDVSVGNYTSDDEVADGARLVAAEPAVAAFASMGAEDYVVDGEVLSGLFVDGEVAPLVLQGRAPRSPEEVALGGVTMDRLGVSIGDTVDVAYQDFPPRTLRVVGRTVLNGAGMNDSVTPGQGVLFAAAANDALVRGDPVSAQVHLVRFRPGTDPTAARARLEAAFPGTVVDPLAPNEVENLRRVAGVPAVLAGLVAVLGIGTALHAMVVAVRRRRRDLAVLKSIGFVRSQVSATLAWQASTFAAVAVVIGTPLGLAVGGWTWRLTADGIGVHPVPVVPVVAVAVVVGATLVVMNVAAALPGWMARRLSPAAVLRAE